MLMTPLTGRGNNVNGTQEKTNPYRDDCDAAESLLRLPPELATPSP